ncbi:hypothetical protein [Chryseobacterium sp. GP-SGM7]|uniref:hypothetical protein n=1 Tax=Chryseobacterium sp. GP-SGM7 TaxID=3411323 RepID=UPI003B9571D4
MEINQLNLKFDQVNNPKLSDLYFQLQDILKKLNQKKLPSETVDYINIQVEKINSSNLNDKPLLNLLKERQHYIVKYVENNHKIFPKNYHRNMWVGLGALVFGLPIGLLLAYIFNNARFFALGLITGAGIGTLAGISMDKKVLREGRQLTIELKF